MMCRVKSFEFMKHIHETLAFLVKSGILWTSVYNGYDYGSQNAPLRRNIVFAVARIQINSIDWKLLFPCDFTGLLTCGTFLCNLYAIGLFISFFFNIQFKCTHKATKTLLGELSPPPPPSPSPAGYAD